MRQLVPPEAERVTGDDARMPLTSSQGFLEAEEEVVLMSGNAVLVAGGSSGTQS
jgi:hypothetical protein